MTRWSNGTRVYHAADSSPDATELGTATIMDYIRKGGAITYFVKLDLDTSTVEWPADSTRKARRQ